MTTVTQTTRVVPSLIKDSIHGHQETVAYPDEEWSSTFVNYYKDAEQAPPDTLNSALSEHEIRMARRSDDSPHIAKTPVKIKNIRGREKDYSFSKQGFKIGYVESRMKNWHDDSELKQVYFPEVTELLKRETGARYVFQYEWHVRGDTLENALNTNSKGAVDINGPVRRVHIDESPASARKEYNCHVRPNGPGNEHLRGRPCGIYNVWKPLKTIIRDPLCLCDARTVEDGDLQSGKVTVPVVGEIENYSIRAPAKEGAHGFVYLRGQEPTEALVFRIFDDRIDAEGSGKRSHGVAHTSFVDPGTENEPPRESVEVRSFCVF